MQYVKKITNFFTTSSTPSDAATRASSIRQIPISDDSDGKQLWREHFSADSSPQYHVIAPGRVNLIGEHIDHQNYNVLPCAVEKSAHIFLSVEEPSNSAPILEIKHVNSKAFPSRKFHTLKDIKIDKTHHWTNYIVAAYLGMTEYYVVDHDTSKIGTHPKLLEELNDEQRAKIPQDHLVNKSVRMLVAGNLPMAAGLSSSSALVVCAAMCFNAKCPEDPKTIAAICANCERYVGTAGGGMDQAAICLCNKDEAQWIGFNPLTTEAIKLPSELKIVIANTCREAPKVKSAAKMYNKRVFELKTACLWLIQQFASEEADKLDGKDTLNLTLRDVLRKYIKLSEDELLEKLETYIPNKTYTKKDMNEILGDERRKTLLELRCGESVWDKNDDFYLHNRIKHVLTENARVTEFVKTCRELEKETDPQVREKGQSHLGELLNGSAKSLHEDFDASCEEIEELCQIAREAGAVGSRLTGAGWGGCTVSLVPEGKVNEFMEKVRAKYFVPYVTKEKTKTPPLEVLPSTVEGIDEVFFATTPAQCARVVPINPK